MDQNPDQNLKKSAQNQGFLRIGVRLKTADWILRDRPNLVPKRQTGLLQKRGFGPLFHFLIKIVKKPDRLFGHFLDDFLMTGPTLKSLVLGSKIDGMTPQK